MKIQVAQLVESKLLVAHQTTADIISYLPRQSFKVFIVHPDMTLTRNTHHVTYVEYLVTEDVWVLQIDDNPSSPISGCGDDKFEFEIYENSTSRLVNF